MITSNKHKVAVFIFLLFLGLSSQINSQSWIETQKVVASDRAANDNFGFGSVILNNQLIIGAYENGNGRVYVFDKINNSWTESYNFIANDSESYANFGKLIIGNDHTLVINDPSKNENGKYDTGAVYLYQKNDQEIWEHHSKLIANNTIQYGRFGTDYGLDDTTLAIGSELGNVNIFEYNAALQTWNFSQEIVSSDGNTYHSSADVNDEFLAIGSYEHDENGSNETGAAYIFEKDANTGNWIQIQKILSPEISQNQRFGKEVFFHNDFLFIASVTLAKVYVYQLNHTTNQFDYVQLLGGESGYGNSIAAENDTLVIGAYSANYDENNTSYLPDSGAVYVYNLLDTNHWEFSQKITNSDRDNINWFGNSVSIENDIILSGAPYQDKDENNDDHKEKAGAAYIFELDSNLSIVDSTLSELSVYPNPTLGTIYINAPEEVNSIAVFDSTGKVLKTYNSRINNLSLSDYQNGLYFIQITDNKQNTTSFKIIKN
jgi:hypothetical protein